MRYQLFFWFLVISPWFCSGCLFVKMVEEKKMEIYKAYDAVRYFSHVRHIQREMCVCLCTESSYCNAVNFDTDRDVCTLILIKTEVNAENHLTDDFNYVFYGKYPF